MQPKLSPEQEAATLARIWETPKRFLNSEAGRLLIRLKARLLTTAGFKAFTEQAYPKTASTSFVNIKRVHIRFVNAAAIPKT
jgi:hypothetical protein